MYDTFLASDQRCQKYIYILKVMPGGRAEIQNVRICKV